MSDLNKHPPTVERVNELIATGHTQEAINLCRRICNVPGAKAQEWLLYGNLSADMGDHVTARKALGEAISLNPDLVAAQFGLGKVLAAIGKYPEAIDRLRDAVHLQPDNPDIWLVMGVTCGLAGQMTEAEDCCRRSLELQPDSVDAMTNLAGALQAQGKLREAEILLSQGRTVPVACKRIEVSEQN
jgi:protein O-GlcNAc transferase